MEPEEREQRARPASMSEEEIDTSDIPEITDEMWERVFQPGLHRPIKRPVTIRLDADVVSWFKEHAGDKPYQTEINRVLRRHVVNAKRHA